MRQLYLALFVVTVMSAARHLWMPEALELDMAFTAALITLILVLLEGEAVEWWRERHPPEDH